MISCDVCGKEFEYSYLLIRHLERKIPCHPPIQIKKQENKEPVRPKYECKYCMKTLSSAQRFRIHKDVCNMMKDSVRQLEIQLCRDVVIEPESKTCRFCEKDFYNRRNMKRHDSVCKSKNEYRQMLMEEMEAKGLTINNTTNNNNSHNTTNNTTNNNTTNNNNTMINNVIFNNTMDWNDREAMMELLEQIIPLDSIKHYTRTGDVAVSLGDIARKYYEHTDSVRCTNLKTNTVRCRENGKFITRDADYVNAHNIETMIHRVQDASDEGVLVPNIDEYGRLDGLIRQDIGALSRDERGFLKKVFDEQKRASHRVTVV